MNKILEIIALLESNNLFKEPAKTMEAIFLGSR